MFKFDHRYSAIRFVFEPSCSEFVDEARATRVFLLSLVEALSQTLIFHGSICQYQTIVRLGAGMSENKFRSLLTVTHISCVDI
jgi:hypothetical protein